MAYFIQTRLLAPTAHKQLNDGNKPELQESHGRELYKKNICSAQGCHLHALRRQEDWGS
jgi:hypothetical protein